MGCGANGLRHGHSRLHLVRRLGVGALGSQGSPRERLCINYSSASRGEGHARHRCVSQIEVRH